MALSFVDNITQNFKAMLLNVYQINLYLIDLRLMMLKRYRIVGKFSFFLCESVKTSNGLVYRHLGNTAKR